MTYRKIQRLSLLLIPLFISALIFESCAEVEQTKVQKSDGLTSSSTAGVDLKAHLATKDLGIGTNRISFILQTSQSMLELPEVNVANIFLSEDGTDQIFMGSQSAKYYEWPFGTRGNYVTELYFYKPGWWQIEVLVPGINSPKALTTMRVRVKDKSFTPGLRSLPPLTLNKTTDTVEKLEELTTWPTPNIALYQSTIEDALEQRIPLVVVVASPGFCVSPTCGPQVETILELKNIYKERANFIHVEVYDNPHEINENLRQGRYSPVVEAWAINKLEGYINESWVFIMNASGKVSSKYEGYASLPELEEGLRKALNEDVFGFITQTIPVW